MALAYEFDWTVLARPAFRQLLVDGLGMTLAIAATSTLFSLVVIPVVYFLIKRNKPKELDIETEL